MSAVVPPVVIGNATLYLGDCLDVMRGMDAASASSAWSVSRNTLTSPAAASTTPNANRPSTWSMLHDD